MLFTLRILPVPRLCQRTCHSITRPNSISAGKVYVACVSTPYLETGIQKLRVAVADRSHVGVVPSLQTSQDTDWVRNFLYCINVLLIGLILTSVNRLIKIESS